MIKRSDSFNARIAAALRWMRGAVLIVTLAACGGDDSQNVAQTIPTQTLAPILSLTPRFTATLVPTRTPSLTQSPIPSDTPIPPTATQSPTPTPTPPILGSVFSVQAINMRGGPGLNFDALSALPPGTGFQILGTNPEGSWFNIRLDNGDEGWVSAALVRVQDTLTPFPTLTPTPDLTLLAQGSPLPTSILGGGTVTPTPPRSVVTPTPITGGIDAQIAVATVTQSTPNLGLPVIVETNQLTISQTATALVGGGVQLPTNQATNNAGGPTGGPILTGTPTFAAQAFIGTPAPSARRGVDVLAYCDNPLFGEPPPLDLAVGSTIDVWWKWIATTPELVQQHINAVIYEVTLDGVRLSNYNQYRTSIRERSDGQYEVDWLVPSQPLASGAHRIEYAVSWRTAISDGLAQFGPGTGTPRETGTCNFTVR
jgi:hypothetical protein